MVCQDLDSVSNIHKKNVDTYFPHELLYPHFLLPPLQEHIPVFNALT